MFVQQLRLSQRTFFKGIKLSLLLRRNPSTNYRTDVTSLKTGLNHYSLSRRGVGS